MQSNTPTSSTQSLHTSSQSPVSMSASGTSQATATHTVQSSQPPLASLPQTPMTERTVGAQEAPTQRVNQPIDNSSPQPLESYTHGMPDDRMEVEFLRIASFCPPPDNSSYPNPDNSSYCNNIGALRLSKNGYYFNRDTGKIQCFECKMELPDENDGSDYFQDHSHLYLEHQRQSPNCQVARVTLTPSSDSNTASTTTLPGSLSVNMERLSLSESTQVTASSGGASAHPAAPHEASSEISTTNPKHPAYATLQSRQETFPQDWSLPENQSPEAMSKAGLYYARYADCARCFHCGTGLRNWQPGDNPVEVHNRLALEEGKNCEYLNKLMNNNREPARPGSPVGQEGQPVQPSQPAQRHEPGPAESNKPTQDDILNTLCNMGYRRQAARNAMKANLSEASYHNLNDAVDQLISRLAAQDDTTGANAAAGSEPQPTQRAPAHRHSPPATTREGQQRPATPKASSETGSNAQTIKDENQRLKDERVCKICRDKDSDMTFLPCGHMVSCQECAASLNKCPMCRIPIKKKVRTYLS